MTPSRRLRGPRGLADGIHDSPTKAKTVTFQSVPDVKEFERMSVEGSADGSFELDEEWVDDGESGRDNSLDDILEESALDGVARLRIHRSESPTVNDESTTADFVNTLIEEGLFSPPQLATPAFNEQPMFQIPDHMSAPFLSTPSMGDSVHATPLLGVMQVDDLDSAGIPYGRTHHSDRSTVAHAQSTNGQDISLGQPALPHNEEHKMLLNANAAQPSLPPSTSREAISHQEGAMYDPFITIQTATAVLSPERSRSEDGIPVGRTSHVERQQAARMLATQSLGLGMPRSPAIAKNLTDVQDLADEDTDGQQAEEESGDDGEMLFDASFEMSHEGETRPTEMPKLGAWMDDGGEVSRKLPKPPKPQQLDLPSPVTSPVRPNSDERVVEKRVSSHGV